MRETAMMIVLSRQFSAKKKDHFTKYCFFGCFCLRLYMSMYLIYRQFSSGKLIDYIEGARIDCLSSRKGSKREAMPPCEKPARQKLASRIFKV